MRRRLPLRSAASCLALAVAVAAAAASEAGAGTFCVNTPSCPGGTPLATLEAAEAKVATTAGPDRIEVGPGHYAGVSLGFGPESPVTVSGAGSGATVLAGANVVDLSSAGSIVEDVTVRVTGGQGIDAYEPVVVRDVVVDDAGAPDNVTGISLRGGGTLERVRVRLNTTSPIPSEGVTLAPVGGGPPSPAATLTDVDIAAAWGLRITADTAPHGPVALRRLRSHSTLKGAWINGRVDVRGEQVSLQATNTSATKNVGYGTSLELSGTNGVPAVALRHATIARVAERGEAVSVYHKLGAPMRLALQDSLVLAVGSRSRAFSVQSSVGPAIVSLAHSAWRASGVYFPYASQANARFEVGAGNVDLDRSPAVVPNAGTGDLRPGAGSALIDNGSPGPLATAESALDVRGQARLVDGDRDGAAVRDIGAVEAAAQTSAAHVVPVLHGKPAPPPPPIAGDHGDRPAATAALSRLKARRARRGVRVSFRSSAAAPVRLRLERCVRRRGRPVCKRSRRIATRTVAARAGANVARLAARRLARGRYRVVAQVLAHPAERRSVVLRVRR